MGSRHRFDRRERSVTETYFHVPHPVRGLNRIRRSGHTLRIAYTTVVIIPAPTSTPSLQGATKLRGSGRSGRGSRDDDDGPVPDYLANGLQHFRMAECDLMVSALDKVSATAVQLWLALLEGRLRL